MAILTQILLKYNIFGEISNNWQSDLLGTNVSKTLEFWW